MENRCVSHCPNRQQLTPAVKVGLCPPDGGGCHTDSNRLQPLGHPASLGESQPTGTESTPENGQQPEPNRHQLTPAGHHSVWQQMSGPVSAGPVSTVRSATPAQHAAAILDFLQAPGGRTGAITAKELREIHAEVCFVLELEPIGWTAVGRELRKLIGGGRTYHRINGEQVRVYRIPPRALPTQARLFCA